MLHQVFSVYDSKAGIYLPPFYLQTKGQALRQFADTVNGSKENQIANHPEDFTLFELGIFDDLICQFTLHETPISLGVAIEFKRETS